MIGKEKAVLGLFAAKLGRTLTPVEVAMFLNSTTPAADRIVKSLVAEELIETTDNWRFAVTEKGVVRATRRGRKRNVA